MLATRFLYLYGRAGATFASLCLALLYSRDLGVINRSSISMIMTTNALLWIVLTSGTTLTIRKIGWTNAGTPIVHSFITAIATQFLIVLLMYFVVINLYSLIKNPIPFNLLILSIIYVISSGIHLVFLELLLSAGRFKAAGILEVVTILIQVLLYLIGSSVREVSVASRLLLAFSIAYVLVSALALILILDKKKYFFRFGSLEDFLKLSRHNHLLGASLGFMDRVDRVLIGFLLATPILGKYAVATTLIALLRFFPDGISKLIMAKKITLKRLEEVQSELVIFSAIVLTSAVIFFSLRVINYWLGSEWLLTLPVYITIALQELTRGFYQVTANQKILHDRSEKVHIASIIVPLAAVPAATLGVTLFGLIAIPISFFGAYLLGIVIMRWDLNR